MFLGGGLRSGEGEVRGQFAQCGYSNTRFSYCLRTKKDGMGGNGSMARLGLGVEELLRKGGGRTGVMHRLPNDEFLLTSGSESGGR